MKNEKYPAGVQTRDEICPLPRKTAGPARTPPAMPAESFVDEDEQERQIQECEASAMQMKKRVRWFCLVSGCLLSAVFAYYALAQTTQV